MNGRVALVSGAARGIGAAIALRLAEAGATVVALDRAAFDAPHPAIRPLIADVAEPSVSEALRDALAPLGRCDICIPAAGIATVGGPLSPPDAWDRVLRVNLDGAYRLVAAAWPWMEARRDGRIVLVSSMAAYRGSLVVAAEYTASKGALESLTRHFARHGGPLGIRCNAIAPGVIDTDMTRAFPPPKLADIPMGRAGTAEEVADVALFLASDAASYVSGVSVPVAGGLFF